MFSNFTVMKTSLNHDAVPDDKGERISNLEVPDDTATDAERQAAEELSELPKPQQTAAEILKILQSVALESPAKLRGYVRDNTAKISTAADWLYATGQRPLPAESMGSGGWAHSEQDESRVVDDWGIPLGQRFRVNVLHYLAFRRDYQGLILILKSILRYAPELLEDQVQDEDNRSPRMSTPMLTTIAKGNEPFVTGVLENFRDTKKLERILTTVSHGGDSCVHLAVAAVSVGPQNPATQAIFRALIAGAPKEILATPGLDGFTPLHLSAHARFCRFSQFQDAIFDALAT